MNEIVLNFNVKNSLNHYEPFFLMKIITEKMLMMEKQIIQQHKPKCATNY